MNKINHLSTLLIVALITSICASANAAEVYRKKITQFGDPTTPPKTKTSCAKWAKTKVPYCKGSGLSITCGTKTAKTCSGWKTQYKNLQKEIYFVVNGPETKLKRAVKKSVKSCTDKATELATGVAIATYAETSTLSASAEAGLAVAAPFWETCIRTEIGNQFSFGLSTDEKTYWTKWK